ncbi:MAG: hypothetical protein ABJB12_00585 [Pseudomonadota bacterium]
MAAAHKNPALDRIAVVHGMLQAKGETVAGAQPSDFLDVFVDQEGDLVVLLLDLQAPPEASEAFSNSLMREAREALEKHTALHSLVNRLEVLLAARPRMEVGLLVLRLSERDARVEILNAGMPAVASAGPGDHVAVYPALSDALGRRVGEVHPYELVPLAWGSTWLALSDGALDGSAEPDRVAALCAALDLTKRGSSLTAEGSDEHHEALQALLPRAQPGRADATLVLVSSDPPMRFK